MLAFSFFSTSTCIAATSKSCRTFRKWAWLREWPMYYLHHSPPCYNFSALFCGSGTTSLVHLFLLQNLKRNNPKGLQEKFQGSTGKFPKSQWTSTPLTRTGTKTVFPNIYPGSAVYAPCSYPATTVYWEEGAIRRRVKSNCGHFGTKGHPAIIQQRRTAQRSKHASPLAGVSALMMQRL